jgi:hypothetical protein
MDEDVFAMVDLFVDGDKRGMVGKPTFSHASNRRLSASPLILTIFPATESKSLSPPLSNQLRLRYHHIMRLLTHNFLKSNVKGSVRHNSRQYVEQFLS